MNYADDELRQWLATALAAEWGRRVGVARLDRAVAPYHSSWQMEQVDVTLDDGRRVPIILKDLSPAATLDGARDVRPAFLVDPTREIGVYRRLLKDAALDTPRFLGAWCDAKAQRYLLALERVDATPLWQVGDFAAWAAAAQWLARLHGLVITAADAPMLLRYDVAYYARWIGRAVRNCEARADAIDPHELGQLRRLADQYDRVTQALARLPVTFIHGEFQPSNVLITPAPPSPGDPSPTACTVRPVDWEMAALGPSLMDLADLTAGRWTAAERQAMVDAYLSAGGGGAFASRAALDRALGLCRLHRAVQWLGWAAPEWRPPKEHAQDWLGEAVSLAALHGFV